MGAVVVDTNVISFILKADTRAAIYKPHLEGKELIISFMTLAELHRWALKRYWKETRLSKLQQYLKEHYAVHFADELVCRKWAEIREEGRKKGKQVETDDAWIAATAILLQLPLVTHNRKDFESIEGLQVIFE